MGGLILAIVGVMLIILIPIGCLKLVNGEKAGRAGQLINIMNDQAKASGGSFVPKDIVYSDTTALVFDETGKQFYVGSAQKGLAGKSPARGQIYPLSAIINYSQGNMPNGGFTAYFLDITVNDLSNPTWRLWFMGSSTEAARVTAAFDVAMHRYKHAAV